MDDFMIVVIGIGSWSWSEGYYAVCVDDVCAVCCVDFCGGFDVVGVG
jgi:hypothetical protein